MVLPRPRPLPRIEGGVEDRVPDPELGEGVRPGNTRLYVWGLGICAAVFICA